LATVLEVPLPHLVDLQTPASQPSVKA
jgi:hypothetical protein